MSGRILGIPQITLTPLFLSTLSVVYAYWVGECDNFGGSGFFWNPLVLKLDNGTPLGRQVGTYTPVDGFMLPGYEAAPRRLD